MRERLVKRIEAHKEYTADLKKSSENQREGREELTKLIRLTAGLNIFLKIS